MLTTLAKPQGVVSVAFLKASVDYGIYYYKNKTEPKGSVLSERTDTDVYVCMIVCFMYPFVQFIQGRLFISLLCFFVSYRVNR